MSKLVQCKACNKEVAKGVKKCPSCGKDQRSFFGRHKILSFVGGIIVLGIVVGALGGESDDTTVSKGATKEKEEKIYSINETVEQDGLEFTVTKVEEKGEVGDEYIGKKASDGGTLVTVQYTLKNVSDEPIGMFDYETLNLVDEKGTKYDEDIDATSTYAVETDIDNSKVLSDLNPDIQVTGVGVFEVSKEKYGTGKWYIKYGDIKVGIK